MVTLSRLVFALALIHNNVASDVQGKGGPIQGDRCRTGDIGPIPQKIATVAGTFEALFIGEPAWRTPQVGTDGNEHIEAFGVANQPHPLVFLKTGTDLPDLIVVWLPSLKAG